MAPASSLRGVVSRFGMRGRRVVTPLISSSSYSSLSNNHNVLSTRSLRSSIQAEACFTTTTTKRFEASGQRAFGTSPILSLRTSEFTESEWKSVKVDGKRLMDEIHHTCQWGTGERWGSAATETGMTRLALSDTDKAARDWFVTTTQSLGCTTTIDAMGNIFAVRPGLRDGPATFIGSHLDTQPTGGRYDGILGVHAGVEMLRVLNENWIETEFPVGVVNWTNEEGARFPISMVSSGVWAGGIPLEKAHNLREVGGGTGTMKSELERIGYLGSTPASYEAFPIGAHFELHIEQGPILEREQKKIGVVEGVQAYRWFTINVKGQDAHTGTTPFESRSDALLLSTKLILHAHKLATHHSALATTGILTLSPGSTNTIPGTVSFSLDIRSPSDAVLDTLEAALRNDFADVSGYREGSDFHPESKGYSESVNVGTTPGLPCEVSWRTDSVSRATVFHEDCIACVRAAGEMAVGAAGVREMTSGAGHDSVYASWRAPTSMVFVPCRNGVSHNPKEFCKPEDCEVGAQVIMGAVLRFDRLRWERGY